MPPWGWVCVGLNVAAIAAAVGVFLFCNRRDAINRHKLRVAFAEHDKVAAIRLRALR